MSTTTPATGSPDRTIDRAADPAADRAAVTGLIDALTAAWNAGDADAYGAPFSDDATYVNFLGQVVRGRAAIVETHRWLFERMPGSQMVRGGEAERQIRFPAPDTAVAVGVGPGTTVSGGQPDPARASAVSFVAVRTGEGWRLTHFQNTRVQPLPAG